MFAQNYLSLRLVRLKPADEWLTGGPGLFFIFVKGGGGKYLGGSVTHRLSAGDVLVWNGEAGGKLLVGDGGEVVFWCFSLSFEHLFPLFSSEEISLLQNVIDGLKSAKLYHAGAQVARECNRLLAEVPPQFNLDHRTQLLRIVGAILTVEFAAARPQRVGFIRVEEHMLQVFERLTSQELLTLSVGDLAKKFSCSRRHLNRLFHQYFGFSVAALRMEMRLLKAVSLLRDPNIKVINVAEQCGFNHLGLFNTCFKRRFGKTPGEWRKMASPAMESSALRNSVIGQAASRSEIKAKAPLNGTATHAKTALPENGQILLRLNLERAVGAATNRKTAV